MSSYMWGWFWVFSVVLCCQVVCPPPELELDVPLRPLASALNLSLLRCWTLAVSGLWTSKTGPPVLVQERNGKRYWLSSQETWLQQNVSRFCPFCHCVFCRIDKQSRLAYSARLLWGPNEILGRKTTCTQMAVWMQNVIFAFPTQLSLMTWLVSLQIPLCPYHMPGSELGRAGTQVNKHIPCPHGTHGPMERKAKSRQLQLRG